MALPVVIVILGALFLCPSHLWAKPMYITDRIELSLRSGIGLDHRALAMVKTGERVEVLEGDKNWSKVKLANGTIGWINTCFLVDQVKMPLPPDPKMQEDQRGLKEANQNLIREKEILIQEKNRLLKEVEEAKNQAQTLSREKNTRSSPEVAALKTKNEQLDKEVALYKRQIGQFNQTEKRGRTEEQIKWFLIGSVVLVLGLLLGWLLSGNRRKPHRYY
jgi:SH3 domain protein